MIAHEKDGWGGADSLTHSSSQNIHLRTEQVSFLPLLLCAPAESSHGATCEGQQQQHYRSCEDTRAPPAGWTEKRSQESAALPHAHSGIKDVRSILFLHVRHVLFFLA